MDNLSLALEKVVCMKAAGIGYKKLIVRGVNLWQAAQQKGTLYKASI